MKKKSGPKFHGILLTRDDEDIIGPCIAHALTWCDHLYVYETGGFDRTWDIVQEWRAKDSRIETFRFEAGQALMESGLRGYVFERFRKNMTDGDWVVQVDSDEFYHISPKEFVETRLLSRHTAVGFQLYEFRLLESEVENWYRGGESLADRSRSIAERRRHYEMLNYTEPRMFKYRPHMQWPPHVAYPYNLGFTARVRIPVRHYPTRDPVQVQKRWALRKILAPDADTSWMHWRHGSWRDLVTPDSAEGLHFWPPGADLEADPYPLNPVRQPKRAVQFLVRYGPNRLLDLIRPKPPVGYRPRKLAESTVSKIRHVFEDIEACGRANTVWQPSLGEASGG